MPLSEDEQRILQEIEKSLYEDDPAFARAVTNNNFDHASRNCKLAALGFVLSFAVLLVMFTKLLIVAFVGFVGMVACAAIFVRNLRRLLRSRLQDSDRDVTIEDLKTRFRNRFGRSE